MSKYAHHVSTLKDWIKIHSVALGVTATLIVVLGGVLGLFFIDSRFSPNGSLTGSDNAAIRLQISDRDDKPKQQLLANDLNDPTAPDYRNFTGPITIPRSAVGDLPNLFRLQGTLAYNSPTMPDKATIVIELPPLLLFVPDRLIFGRDTYTFSGGNGGPLTVQKNTGDGTESVNVQLTDDATTDPRGKYYLVTISNIDRKRFALNLFEQTQELYARLNPFLETAQAYAPPPAANLAIFRRPYQMRLTFRNLGRGSAVPAANIDTMVGYLSERGEQDRLYFGNSNCGGGASDRGYLCSKIAAKASAPKTGEITLSVQQKIELEGVYLSGNIAALIEIQNLRLRPNSIAVGGTLTQITGGTKLKNYLTLSSILKWTNGIEEQVTKLYDRRNQGTIAQRLNNTTWRLNAPSAYPDDSTAATTFSSPPEGKLWKTSNNLTFDRDVTFDGSGTILVNGNLTFKGTVSCSGAKRLAFIVRGNITFNGRPNVGCGAYVALGSADRKVPGNLSFTQDPAPGGAIARGIFVARNDIQIPAAASAPQLIDYDSDFAADPTILFREFMSLILTASS